MNRGRALILFILFLFPFRLNAFTYPCNCATIEGLVPAHDKGIRVLGTSTVALPEKMSVYVTLADWHGAKVLYLLSNLKPSDKPHPNNLFTTDQVNLTTLLFTLADPHSRAYFNRSQVTYYVEPSFFDDPYWNTQKDRLVGTVCALALDGTVQSHYVQKEPGEKPVPQLNSPVPEGWVEIVQGTVQQPDLSVPPEILEKSKQPHTDLVVVDPQSLKGGGTAFIALETTTQDVLPGHTLSITALKNFADQYAQTCSCQVFASNAFVSNGQPVVRVIQTHNSGPQNLCSVVFFFQHGSNLDSFTGTSTQDQYAKYGPIFQDAFQNMLKSQ